MPPTINPAIPCPALTRLRWTRCVLVRRALWPRLFMIVSLTKKRKKTSPRWLWNHFSSKMTLRAAAAIIKSTGSNTVKSTGSPLLADVGSTCDLSFGEFLCFIGSSVSMSSQTSLETKTTNSIHIVQFRCSLGFHVPGRSFEFRVSTLSFEWKLAHFTRIEHWTQPMPRRQKSFASQGVHGVQP